MLAVLLSLSISAFPFTVLTPENWDRIVNGPVPTLVRFHTPHRSYSLALDEQYDHVGEMFEGVDGMNVGAINCGKYRKFCYKQGVPMTSVVRLYTKEAVHEYEGGQSHESISRWATGITGVHGRELLFSLRQPNGRVFKEMIEKTHCVFVMFYNPWCVSCKRFLPHIREVAEAFKYDDRVEFCANDVDLYKFFNWDYDLITFPDLRLYCKDEPENIKYTGRKTAEDLIDFINDYCGTQRGLNGRLNSECGVIDEVSQIVEDFFMQGRKPQFISDMEQVDGTEYYVWVMKEIMSKGNDFVLSERNRLNSMLDSGNLPPKKIDEFQIKVNILSVFASYLAE